MPGPMTVYAAKKPIQQIGVYLLFMTLCLSNPVKGQTLTTGSLEGTLRDPTNAPISGDVIELLNLDTGEKKSVTTNSAGVYHFLQLKPGRYLLSASCPGFAKLVVPQTVNLGETSVADLLLRLAASRETIRVTEGPSLTEGAPGSVTNFTPKEFDLLPAAGQDITTIAFTAPAVVVAPGTGGVGNFSVNGLPATDNLYTVNGENAMDPYLNVNSNGATNLSLGKNEVLEATVIANPYSGQYGQVSGAQVVYVTKSGTNLFHGNAQWWWNGSALNSNDFFANATSTPRPFSVANQWAASFGGPIRKNRTWFFVDTEGLVFILPNFYMETIPTSAFATAVLANIRLIQPAEAAAYQGIFQIFSQATAGKNVMPLPAEGTECQTVTVPGFAPGSPCAETFLSTPTSRAKEWILAARLDHQISTNDYLFFRFKLDHGIQPSFVDPLNAAFNANSVQPNGDLQVQYQHIFAGNRVNQLIGAVSYYSAIFSQDISKWQALFPQGGVLFNFSGGFSGINANVGYFPSGRRVTQYQFVDDYSWIRGNHNMKFGANFRRYDVSDHTFYFTYPTSVFADLTAGTGTSGLQAFADGVANNYNQQESPSTDVPISVWGLGVYAEDQWNLLPTFSVTAVLRLEKYGNPVCQTGCFADFSTSFSALPSVLAGVGGAGGVPYSQDINSNRRTAFRSNDAVNVSPRVAFRWSPNATRGFPWFSGSGKTAVSGGFGLFYDNLPTGLVDPLLSNPPSSILFNISPLDANFQSTGILPFDPVNGGPAAFAAAASAFSISKSYNQLSEELGPIVGFNPPLNFDSVQGRIRSPQVQEWNLRVDQQIGRSGVLSVNYAGNHSIFLIYSNAWSNAVATSGTFENIRGILGTPYPNYSSVFTLQSGAVANYNGVTFSVREQYREWLTMHVNYTYSHALDEVSNGGFFPFAASSLQFQINPESLRANNYGNADYDVRHLFNADFVMTPWHRLDNKTWNFLLAGWQWSGKVYARSGLPFTVLDSRSFSAIAQGGGPIVAQIIAPAASTSCGAAAVFLNAKPVPCLSNRAFLNTSSQAFPGYSLFPNETRNQFRGPHYFNCDMALFKNFQWSEKLTLGVGAMVFNVFNHPNFSLPVANLGDPSFGMIVATQGVSQSPYGSGLGFDSSVRVVQLSLKLSF